MNPELSGSRAVLIGASVYEDPELPDIPAAANSLREMRALLTAPELGAWPVGLIETVENPRNAGRLALLIRRSAERVTDVLLLYFVGHGAITPRGELCLAVSDTDAAAAELTGLEYAKIRRILLDSPAQTKIVILDCCYSGRAIEALSSGVDIADGTAVRGTYVLTASNNAAHVVPGFLQAERCTSFTGELLDMLREGISQGPDGLTLPFIFPYLSQRLLARGLPRPNQRSTGSADAFVFSRNPAFARAVLARPSPKLQGLPEQVAVAPRQLPRAVSKFVGRVPEMRRLTQMLTASQDGESSVSVITGVAGVGKTALAVQWAQSVRAHFPDGHLYVNLHGYSPQPTINSEQALTGFLRALNVPVEQIPVGVDAQSALFRSLLHGKRMLVILDNADSAEQVRAMLPGSQECVTLVTSRSRLSGLVARDDALPMSLPLLSGDEAETLLRAIVGRERVEAEPAAAARLGEQCALLPLALRIAAERVATRPHMTLAGLVAELEDEALDLLDTGDESTAVRAAFSWSYRVLPGPQARLFRLLGLHAGPDISVSASAALAGVARPDAHRLLDALADVSLLEVTADGRYRFHDLLRAYAAERAAEETPEPDRAAAVRRLLEWYLRSADAADRVFLTDSYHVPLDPPEGGVSPMGFGTSEDALAWCDAERANLVAAVSQAAGTGADDVAWKLPVALYWFFVTRKPWLDWIATHHVGLEAAQRLGDRYGESWVMNNLGYAHYELNQLDEALDCYKASIAMRREIGDRFGEAWTLNNLGDVDKARHRLAEALDQYGRALEVFDELDDLYGQGATLYNLGDTYLKLRRFDEAIARSGRALEIFRQVSDAWSEGLALVGLAAAYHDLGRRDEAIAGYRDAVAVFDRIGDRRDEASALLGLASVLQEAGLPDAARDPLARALHLFEQEGFPNAEDVRARLAALGPPRT